MCQDNIKDFFKYQHFNQQVKKEDQEKRGALPNEVGVFEGYRKDTVTECLLSFLQSSLIKITFTNCMTQGQENVWRKEGFAEEDHVRDHLGKLYIQKYMGPMGAEGAGKYYC